MWKYFYILQNILIFIHHIIANAGGSRRKTFANIMHLVEIKLDRTQWSGGDNNGRHYEIELSTNLREVLQREHFHKYLYTKLNRHRPDIWTLVCKDFK